ncbi:OprO/OprP family phosphate-selective porin [Hyalangium gracile]|uniref:OprO/OprP family phosphate-selective porin n=1 Tax=Hyalangium gracile TaxID=394092 RepID=UPI001CCCF64B|nr:OprO/OprP family phosphate-selective porin [Hyalangium gracile]
MSAPALAQQQVAEAEADTSSEDPVVATASTGISTAGISAAGVSAPAVPAPGAAAEAPAKKEKKKAKAEPLGENPDAVDDNTEEERSLRVFGRVFARASADGREEYSRSLSLPSARLGVQAEFGYVEAEVTADLSSRSMLKDAFVRLADADKRLRLYAGQFKAPFLARELESAWDLPLMRRGLVNDYVTETHQLGGRRMGLMGEVRLKETWNLKVAGGLFEGGEDELGQRTSEDASARVSMRPFKALTVGASTYLTQVMEGTRQYAVATDGTLKLGGLELTGELVTGQLGVGPFTAQLGLASYLLPLGNEWALQPVAGAEAMQLRGEMAGRGWAAVGGFNLLFSDTFKAQLQVERALRPGDEGPGTEYLLQLATRF